MSPSKLSIDKNTNQGKAIIAALFIIGAPLAWFVLDKTLKGGVSLGIICLGLVLGGLQALTAMGLIIIYRAIRVINFAQSALGAVSASLAVCLVVGSHWSYWLAVPIGIVAALVAGFLVDLLIQWRFSRAPRLMVTVLTIGIAQLLGFTAIELPARFHLSDFAAFKTPFTAKFSISSITFTGNDVLAICLVPVALALLYWFFVKLDVGVAIRGAADSNERAQLLGIPVRNLTRIVWLVAGGLSGVAAVLAQPITGTGGIATFQLATSMLVPLAAFVLAGMESLPMAAVWSLVIGVLQEAVFSSTGEYVYSNVVLFALIVVGLLFQRSKQVRVTDTGLGDYVAVAEVPRLPGSIAQLKEIRAGKFMLIAGLLALAAALPWYAGTAHTSSAVTLMVYGTIAVSMVVLVGWAGQISLGQFGFVGLGACFAGACMVHLHFPFLLAMLLGGFIGAILAVVVGVPALRLEGTALAVVTLGFAVFMSTYILSSTYFPKLDPSTNKVKPGPLFGRFNLLTPYRSLYEVGLILLVGAVLVATALRRSRSARAIMSVRDNSRASSAYGISPLRSKLLAFGTSGFLAGLAGAIYVVHAGGISSNGFSPTFSLNVFIMVVFGGLGSITGGLVGALAFTFAATYLTNLWQLLATGAGVTLILIIYPDGLGALLFKLRDLIAANVARSKGLNPRGEPLNPQAGEQPALDVMPSAAPTTATVPFGATPVSGNALAHTAALRLGALEDLELQGGPGAGAGTAGPNADPPGGRRALIAVKDMDVAYGNSQVLFDVGLGVAQREIVALLGTNGAGKTTVLRALSGLLRPKTGRIGFLGQDITNLPTVQRVRLGLVTVLGGRGIFPSLTVGENLRLAAWTARRHHKDAAFADAATERIFALFPVLRARQDQRAGLLSGGEQQMLALGQALLCRPRMLLIDELSLGLAPSVVADLLEVIRALSASGVTVVVVEQSVNVATAISNRAIFMERGRVRFSGPTPDLSEQPELLRSVFIHAADKARRRKAAAAGNGGGGGGDSQADAVLAALSGGAPVHDPIIQATPPAPPGFAPDVPAIAAQQANGTAPTAFACVGVSRNFGGVAALTDVTLSVAPGEILGIIGSNGAGKTTLFDVCSGFTKPDTGYVTMDGIDVTSMSPAQRAKRGLGRVFQDARLWPSMTVHEAISTALEQFVPVRDPVAAALYLAAVERSEEAVEEHARELISEFGLARFANNYVSELSTGTRRVVELACAVAHEPRVLLLDEPTSGIAQRESEALAELLLGLREQTGAAFIIIEHDVPVVSSLADRMVCMHLGEVIADGETTDVLTSPLVVAAYLGADAVAVQRSGPMAAVPVGAPAHVSP